MLYQNRREHIYGLGSSLGALAMTDLVAQDNKGPLSPKKPMHDAKAKAVIMLFMEGGPSQVDTFDPKPKLREMHKKDSNRTAGLATGSRFFVGSPFGSRKVGQSGIEMSDQWVHLANPEVADELCNYRGCQAESLNHPEALFHMNTGSRLGGDPAIGSWVNYGLGSINQNLPGYVVMSELALPQGGSRNWNNGFLPAHYQGTRLRPQGSPILDLNAPLHKNRSHQRRALDELGFLNNEHSKKYPNHDELAARMENYELAYRMQMEVPDLMDLNKEPESIKEDYGLNQKHTAAFGKQCLMARRLVEKGVRFVQIFSGGWDSHDYLERGNSARIKSVDKPMAALIKDLKNRGMLDSTLVVWTGEFGRTPDNNRRGGVYALGRGHNIDAMTMMFAGGGVKAGTTYGQSDDYSYNVASGGVHIHDFHATILHLLGIDHERLTFKYQGRYFRLTDVHGHAVKPIIG